MKTSSWFVYHNSHSEIGFMNAPTEPTERFFLSTGIAPGGTAYEGGTAGLDPHGGRNSVFLGFHQRQVGIMWGPRWRNCVQLGFITPISLWFMVPITSYNYSIHGVYKQSNITGGAHTLWGSCDLMWSIESAQIIATSPDVTVKLDLTCWNKVFHVYPKLRITTAITGPTIRLVYPSTQYCSTHSYEIKGLLIYNTSNQELQQSSLVPISSLLRLHGSTPSQTNCPAAAGCWKAFYQSFPARPGSLCRQARGESRLPRGNRAQEFLTTSFLAFSGR